MGDTKRGYLFVISGPSGTGKGAICAGLVADANISLSVSMTTRAPRVGEKDGESYYFVDRTRFEEEIANGGLFEYAEVYGSFYGTPKAPVIEKLSRGVDVILEIEMDGAAQIKKSEPDATLVFIMPPSPEALRKRIESRGTETAERIALRLGQTEREIAKIVYYDYCVVNDDLDGAIRDVRAIMRTKLLTDPARAARDLTPDDILDIKRAEQLMIRGDAQKIVERYKRNQEES